jgi:outer membrane protein insertion porin family
VSTDKTTWQDDAIGGKYYYLGRMELEIPLGSGAKELGIRPSIFMDAGAVWGAKTPTLTNLTVATDIPLLDTNGNRLYTQIDTTAVNSTSSLCEVTASSSTTNATNTNTFACVPTGITNPNTNIGQIRQTVPAFQEYYFGNSWKPRVSIGIGFNWNSPFGPFRIDFAKTLLKQDGDTTKSFTFNVGTQF